MKLVETDTEGPGEGVGESLVEPGPVTPPRPEHRRAMTSMVLTLSVLTVTVVAIYLRFPPRRNQVVTTAISQHRAERHDWELAAPSADKLEGWAIGVFDANPSARPPLPMPGGRISVIGVKRYEILAHRAAVVRYRVGDDEVSLVVQRAHDVPPRTYEQRDGDDLALGWRSGPWTVVAIGPMATAPFLQKALGIP